MLLHPLSIFGLGFGRQAYEVISGAGDEANPWMASVMGDPALQIFIDETTSGAFTIFPIDTPAAPPAGFSPTGDRVAIRCNPSAYDTFPTAPTSGLDIGETFEAYTWVWAASSPLGPTAFALCYTISKDGTTERFFFAVPSEIVLLKKNPLFP